jgi:hypothetical protein
MLMAIEGREAGAVFGVLMFESVYWLAFVTFVLAIPHWRRRAQSAWIPPSRRRGRDLRR